MSAWRRIGLVAALTGVVAAGGQSAQASVDVMIEDGSHCSTIIIALGHVPTTACEAQVVSISNMVFHNHTIVPMTETPVASCATNMLLAIDEGGFGYIYDQVFSGAACGLEPCAEPSSSGDDELTWDFRVRELGGEGAARIELCVNSVTCEMEASFTAVDDHAYYIFASESPCLNIGGAIEVSGGWVIAEGLEVSHDD